jgi:hypothetical protein
MLKNMFFQARMVLRGLLRYSAMAKKEGQRRDKARKGWGKAG